MTQRELLALDLLSVIFPNVLIGASPSGARKVIGAPQEQLPGSGVQEPLKATLRSVSAIGVPRSYWHPAAPRSGKS